MCRTSYRLVVGLGGLTVRSGRSRDLEIIVLRHQLAVLRRYYPLCFIDIPTRRVFYGGITAHPTGDWT